MSSNIFIREEVIFGRAVVVTTNAAAGLFGRVNFFFRTRRYKKIARNSYGLLLTEYIWRNDAAGPDAEFCDAGFWPLAELLAKLQDPPAD